MNSVQYNCFFSFLYWYYRCSVANLTVSPILPSEIYAVFMTCEKNVVVG